MDRRSYKITPVKINDYIVDEIIIDPHVDKHNDHIDNELILELVQTLGCSNTQLSEYKDTYTYFVSLIDYEKSTYKMVWLVEQSKFYIGIITAFKDRRY